MQHSRRGFFERISAVLGLAAFFPILVKAKSSPRPLFPENSVVWGDLGEGLPPSGNLLREAHAALESMITVPCSTKVPENLIVANPLIADYAIRAIYCQELTFDKRLSEPSRIRLAEITMQILAGMINRGDHDISLGLEVPGWIGDANTECKTLDGDVSRGEKVNLRLVVSESPKSSDALLLRFAVLMGKAA